MQTFFSRAYRDLYVLFGEVSLCVFCPFSNIFAIALMSNRQSD